MPYSNWQRRGTYLSLVHDQYLVDMLTEEDIAAGTPSQTTGGPTPTTRWTLGAIGTRVRFTATSARVLANFTYQPIEQLSVVLPMSRPVKKVTSANSGPLKFDIDPSAAPPGFTTTIKFNVPLELTDMIVLE